MDQMGLDVTINIRDAGEECFVGKGVVCSLEKELMLRARERDEPFILIGKRAFVRQEGSYLRQHGYAGRRGRHLQSRHVDSRDQPDSRQLGRIVFHLIKTLDVGQRLKHLVRR